jgi:stage V sporulation protein G
VDITDIRIRRVESEGKLRAYVTLTFDDCFAVHNLKIIKGQSGTFVAMPSRKTQTGEYKDIAHPINSEFRNHIQRQILAAYEKVVSSPGAGEPLAAVEEEDREGA